MSGSQPYLEHVPRPGAALAGSRGSSRTEPPCAAPSVHTTTASGCTRSDTHAHTHAHPQVLRGQSVCQRRHRPFHSVTGAVLSRRQHHTAAGQVWGYLVAACLAESESLAGTARWEMTAADSQSGCPVLSRLCPAAAGLRGKSRGLVPGADTAPPTDPQYPRPAADCQVRHRPPTPSTGRRPSAAPLTSTGQTRNYSPGDADRRSALNGEVTLNISLGGTIL